MMLGFDKSSYDGTVNWQFAKLRGIEFTTMRASSGLDEDTLYKTESLKAAFDGVPVIPYHYYIPKKYTPQAQAEKFLQVMGYNPNRAMIDLEDYKFIVGYKGIALKELKPFLSAIEQATNKKPYIYTSPSYIKNYFVPKVDTWLSEYPLIIANYQVSAPYIPAIWTPLNLAGWQFTATADAPYYGFEQALGCALQVMYDGWWK